MMMPHSRQQNHPQRWKVLLVIAGCARAFEAFPKPLVSPARGSTRRLEVPPLQSLFAPVATEPLAAAVAGGTIGVLGSVVAIEVKKSKIQKDKDCPYCDGVGSLLCAHCFGEEPAPGEPPCPVCGGVGYVACENCKGRGRFIPTMLDRRASRDPESAAEDIGLL